MLRIVSNAPINILLDHSVTIICQYCIDYKKDIFIQAETWVVKECMHEPMTQQTFLLVKTYWRRLEDVFSVTVFCLPRRLQDVWIRLQGMIARRLTNTSWRRLEDVLRRRIAKTSWIRLGRRKIVSLKTSLWRLEDVLDDKRCLLAKYNRKKHWLLSTYHELKRM